MLLTTGQAAEELGCVITTFRRLVRAGSLPGLSGPGVQVMIPLAAVQALQTRPPAPLQHLKPARSPFCAPMLPPRPLLNLNLNE
ncbi:helix-turn-helix domain-containing protein [Streptomyces sp. NPDC059909]|uniref:helix-turn-helix domain-containing protein n=1 Tax=Streptomyces sp. NPDC059909 TaxID=3346998 RepID=UPI00366A204A